MIRAAALALMAVSSATAQEWHVMEDERFGYSVPIPQEYNLSLRPEAGNTRLYHNEQGDILAVWGGRLDERSFVDEVQARRRQDEDAGWDITYQRVTDDWASYSGVQGDQIRYVRAIRYCSDRTAFFLIDYAQSEKERYDPLVTHMVRQMKPNGPCRSPSFR